MRWPLALVCGMTLVALGSGCRSCDKVERELRARDADLQELRGEMERLECYNKALQHEMRGMRGDYNPFLGPDKALLSLSPVRSLALGRQTGGYDTGNCAGDGALQVVLEPRDCDNHVIKVPAAARIQALEVTAEGTKKPLSEWDVSPDQLRTTWRNGLFGSGYSLILNWKVYPTTTKLRVIAQLQSADGRVFEADKDVTVKLVPPAQRQAAPDEKTGPPEDPLFPQTVPPDPTPAGPKPSNTEKLRTPPSPVDWGPALPPPLPVSRSASASNSGWGPPATPAASSPGWGTAQGVSTSTSGWGAPTAPITPPIQLEAPRPVPPEW